MPRPKARNEKGCPAHSLAPAPRSESAARGGGSREHRFTAITVVGEDDTGLLAEIMALLFERSITIEDLPQAVREGVFRMRMHVDTAEMGCSEATLREELAALGKELDVEVQGRLPADREPRSIAVAVSRESHRLEAISRHPNDGLTRIRGRTQVRGPDTSDFRLGGPEGLTDWLPDRPIDGLGEFVAERPGADDGTACAHGDGTESEGD